MGQSEPVTSAQRRVLVLVVQHGQKTAGPGDPGLTARGREQARRAAGLLASIGPVDRLLSSPLRRARETAEEIALVLGLPILVDDRLRERVNWEKDDHPVFEDFEREWKRSSADRHYVPAGGESSIAAGERFLAVVREQANADAAIVALVSHGGVTVDGLRSLLGDAAVRDLAPEAIDDGVPNGAVTTFAFDGLLWTVDEVASTQHLLTPDVR